MKYKVIISNTILITAKDTDCDCYEWSESKNSGIIIILVTSVQLCDLSLCKSFWYIILKFVKSSIR